MKRLPLLARDRAILLGERPIFGTRCGKSAKTIWATFWKHEQKENHNA